MSGIFYASMLALILLVVNVVNTVTKTPAEKLLEEFGTKYAMNATQTFNLFKEMGIADWNYNGSKKEVIQFTHYIGTH